MPISQNAKFDGLAYCKVVQVGVRVLFGSLLVEGLIILHYVVLFLHSVVSFSILLYWLC